MELIAINGQPVQVPDEVRLAALNPTAAPSEVLAKWGSGPAAVEKWFAEQDAPHATAALQRSGLKKGDVTCTGFGGAMLTSDVERATQAKRPATEAPKPDAPAASPTPPPTTES